MLSNREMPLQLVIRKLKEKEEKEAEKKRIAEWERIQKEAQEAMLQHSGLAGQGGA